MPDTDRLINKAQGDDIITALNGITSRLQEMYTVDDALSSTSEHPVQNKVIKEALDDKADESELADKADKSDIASTQTISGNPITLTDCAPINAESLVVELEPKQDLHGYDHPWVGGAEKNKWNFEDYLTVCKANNPLLSWTESDGVYAINSVGNLYETKYSFANTDAQVTLSVDIKLHSSGETETVWVILLDSQNNEVNSTTATLSADYTHLTVSGVASKVWITYQYGRAVDIKCPQIESGSSATSFAPWENICPITGYDEVKVDDVGFNQWDEEWELGIISVSDGSKTSSNTNIRSKNYIPVIGGKTYYFTNDQLRMPACYDENKTFISAADATAVGSSGWLLTMPESAKYMLFDMSNGYGTTYLNNLSLNKPNTDHEYHPYQSTSATIQFGQTVYGGSVDFKTGVVTVDKGFEVFDGSNDEGWVGRNENKSRTTSKLQGIIKNASSDGVAVNFLKSNMFKKGSADEGWGGDPNIIGVGTDGLVYTSTGETMSISDWTTYLVNNNLQICYELATPFMIQLTPDELKLLKGTNNLSADGVMQIGYQPDNVIGDVKGEIEKCAVDAEFMQFTDGTDTFTDVNLSLDALSHTVSVVGSKIEQKRFICFEVMDKMGGVLQGILASCIAFTDGAKTPSGTAFRAYIESLQMYVNFRIYGSGGSYTLAYQSETSFSASAFYVRVRMMNNL